MLGFGAISGVGLQSFYALRFVPYIPPGPTETTEMTFDRNGRGNMERLSRPPAFLLQTWLVRLRKGVAAFSCRSCHSALRKPQDTPSAQGGCKEGGAVASFSISACRLL